MTFTQRDLQNLLTAVNMIEAGEWDHASYGRRPDWEILAEKIKRAISERKPEK